MSRVSRYWWSARCPPDSQGGGALSRPLLYAISNHTCCVLQARDLDLMLRTRDNPNWFEDIRRLLRISQVVLNAMQSKGGYCDALLLTDLQWAYLISVDHPILHLLRASPLASNEELGEVSLSVLSMTFANEGGAKVKHERVAQRYRATGAHAGLSNTCKKRLGVDMSHNMHETTDASLAHERAAVATHLAKVTRELIFGKGLPVFLVDGDLNGDWEEQSEDDNVDEVEAAKNKREAVATKLRIGSAVAIRRVYKAPAFLPAQLEPDIANHIDLIAKRYVNNIDHDQIRRWESLSPADRLRADKDGRVDP